MAIASLLLGVLTPLCLGPLAGVPAVILGHLARADVRRSEGRRTGGGMARAGLWLGYGGTVVYLVLLMTVFVPTLRGAREKQRRAISAMNLRAIGLAVLIYSSENVGRMPTSLDQIKPYLRDPDPAGNATEPGDTAKLLIQPGSTDLSKPGYELAPLPEGVTKEHQIRRPHTVVIVREIRAIGKHPRLVVFADGHVGDEPASGVEAPP